MSTTEHPQVETLLAQQDWLRSLVRELVRDPNAAADLEQDTWLAALNAPPTQLGGGRAWLRTVAKRLAQRKFHTNRARREREEDVSRKEALPATVKAVAHAESIKALVEATLALEDPFRETVLLRYFEDLSPQEVAEQMGVPASTVRSRLTRAHGKLREELTGKVEAADLPGLGWFAALAARGRGVAATLGVSPTAVAIGAALLLFGSLFLAIGLGAIDLQFGGSGRLSDLKNSSSMGAGRVTQTESVNDPSQVTAALAMGLTQESPRTGTRTELIGDPSLSTGETVKGNILAPDGTAIRDAELVIKVPGSNRSSRQILSAGISESVAPRSETLQLQSNAEGEFEIPVRFLVAKQRFQNGAFVIAFEPAASTRFAATSQTLEIGSPIELRPNWQVRFAGVVRDGGTGKPVDGVKISYGPDKLKATTDDEGYFQFENVPNDQGRTAQFDHPDYVLASHGVALIGSDPAVQEFTLERGLGLELAFVDSESGGAVSEVVLFLDEEGLASRTCDPDGRARLRIASQGTQRLIGECPGYANFVWRFRADQIAVDQVLRIPMTALSFAHGTVTDSTVTDSTASTVTGAKVNSYPTLASVGTAVLDLPGTLWRTLIGVRGWEPSLSQATVDPSGAFELAFLRAEGPWRVDVWAPGGKSASQHVDSLGETIKLVLDAAPPAPEMITVTGRLMRDGLPWGQEVRLTLTGVSADAAFAKPDGRFRLEGQPGGQSQLVYQGECLMSLQLEQSMTLLDLGDIDLGHLPRLTLRFETSQGAPLADMWVRVCALTPPSPTITVDPDYPVLPIETRTDAKGQIDLLLPRQGDYGVTLSGKTPLHQSVISVFGNLDQVICLPAPKTIYLRWIHGTSGRPITDDGLNTWTVAWRRPGEMGSSLVRGTATYRGISEFVCPAGPLELSLRPGLVGFQSQTVTQAQLARNTKDNPLDVTLVPGIPLDLELGERLYEIVADEDIEIDLYLIKTSELHLVRDRLRQEERIALAANWKSVRFIDPHLALFQIHPSRVNMGWNCKGLDPGSYTVVAFDKLGRRSDLHITPAEFEVGPEHTSIRLGLTLNSEAAPGR